MLIAIADRLRGALRDTDTVALAGADVTAARLGGDEFIVLLDGLRDHGDAARVAERLLNVLAVPYRLDGHSVQISASIGVTTNTITYAGADQMIRDADTAMYRAKAAGKARFIIFDQRMHEQAMERLTLENDLRQALESQSLCAVYQPIVCLESGRTVGFESLLRWKHPQRGIISPTEFIPLAEEIGMVVPIGAWVMDTACRQMADWQRRLDRPDLFVSVNLSRLQLGWPELIPLIERSIRQHGLSPRSLKLEITESAVMEDMDNAVRVLERIHAMGVELLMDDFGTGYSSLSCLHRFPLTGLKIDRAFVNTVGERHDYAAVVNAIVSLAHNLKIQLVAEGVETEDQMSLLQALGCDLAQGYYFAHPMDPGAAERFLAAHSEKQTNTVRLESVYGH